MILGIIKSLFYMFIFYIFLRISNFLIKFFYTLFYKKNENNNNSENNTLSMLQCSVCQVYITKNDAYKINEKIFCKDHKPPSNN